MPTESFTVKGMTCGHCVRSVTQEVEKIEGVSDVEVDLDSGRVTVTSDHPLADTDLRAAIDEAGFELAPNRS